MTVTWHESLANQEPIQGPQRVKQLMELNGCSYECKSNSKSIAKPKVQLAHLPQSVSRVPQGG